MLSKKSITVIISVAVGLAVALLAVLLVMKYAKDAFKDGTSSYLSADSSDSSYASSSEPAQAVSAPVDNGIRLSITSPESKNIKTTENKNAVIDFQNSLSLNPLYKSKQSKSHSETERNQT